MEQTSPVTESNPDGSFTAKTRRQRTSFTQYQIEQMEEAFQLSKYIDAVAREELGARLGLCESRVNVNDISLLVIIISFI
jgi:Ca2+-binding EF-hand superfamily protein